MLSTIADAVWSAPVIDYHALAPEIVLGGGIVLLLVHGAPGNRLD